MTTIVCYDLMEMIGKEYKLIKLEKKAREQYNDFVNEMDDMFFDVKFNEVEILIDIQYYFIESEYGINPYNEHVFEAIDEKLDITEVLHQNRETSLISSLKKLDD
jgi:hypothetical protein